MMGYLPLMAKAKKSRSKAQKTTIQVDIVSDIVCPWCWLGVKLFEKAAKQSKHDIQLSWRPYMLDPAVPEGGLPYRDYMKQKFGDAPSNRFKEMRTHLETMGPDYGIEYKFDDIPMRPNTLNAHRLIRWAGGQGLADAAANALFEAIFKNLEDIGDHKVLGQIAENIGLDKDLVTKLLAQDDDKDKVTEEIAFFQRLGISGVPSFIYEGQYVIQGAQTADVHIDALEKAASLASNN